MSLGVLWCEHIIQGCRSEGREDEPESPVFKAEVRTDVSVSEKGLEAEQLFPYD